MSKYTKLENQFEVPETNATTSAPKPDRVNDAENAQVLAALRTSLSAVLGSHDGQVRHVSLAANELGKLVAAATAVAQ